MHINNIMPPGKPQVRLYGSACGGDTPYSMYICLDCAMESGDKKVTQALKDFQNEQPDNI